MSKEAYRTPSRSLFHQEPKLIPLNLEILEVGAKAVRVLEMVATKK